MMESIQKTLAEEFREPEARRDYAEEFLDSYVALQIKTLRLQRGLSQAELGELSGMKQSRISTMEQADYSSWSVSTLKRLAEAFDLALIIRFESFGELLRDVTSMTRDRLEKPSFAQDRAFRDGAPAESESQRVQNARVISFRAPQTLHSMATDSGQTGSLTRTGRNG